MSPLNSWDTLDVCLDLLGLSSPLDVPLNLQTKLGYEEKKEVAKRQVDHSDFSTVYPWSCLNHIHFISRTFLGQSFLVKIVIQVHVFLAFFVLQVVVRDD